MTFHKDAYIAQIRNEKAREIIKVYFKNSKSLDEIHNPKTQADINRKRAAICAMDDAKVDHYAIACLLQIKSADIKDILASRKEYEQPVRTMNWEALA